VRPLLTAAVLSCSLSFARAELTLTAPATCEEGARVALEAKWPEAADASFAWGQVRGPKVALSAATGASVTFAAPQALADYELEFECRSAAAGAVKTARHVVKVRADDDPPLAQTFVPRESECGAVLLLTGQGQNPEILQGITYAWRQVGDGPRVTLEYADRPQAWCTPPEHEGPYKLEFEFAVMDGVNKPTVAKVEIAIECDPRFAPLAPEQVLELPRGAFLDTPLPRGSWVMSGVLVLTPDAADKPATLIVRMPTTPRTAAAINYEAREGRGIVRRYGLERDAKDEWKEPQLSGNQDLGDWPLDKPLGLEIGWNGRSLSVRFGEPGKRETWFEPPFPTDMNLPARPRSVWLDVHGAKLELTQLRVLGR
jgi:hypothetical protein